MSTEPKTPRPRGLVRIGGVLLVFGTLCAVAMSAFNLGLAHGMATAGVALVIYSIPAAIFDWPRITLSDLFDVLSAAVSAIVGFVSSLFDW